MMKKDKNDAVPPKRRFSKARDGEEIMRLYRLMPTAQIARMKGLEPRKISDFAYRNNNEDCLKKDAAERSQVASENGKKGGRPRKNQKIKS